MLECAGSETLPPLALPGRLTEAVQCFLSLSDLSSAQLVAYSRVAELVENYVKNFASYATFTDDVAGFSAEVEKAVKAVTTQLELTNFQEDFTVCCQQWKSCCERVSGLLTTLMLKLNALKQRAADLRRPVTGEERGEEVTLVTDFKDEKATLRSEQVYSLLGPSVDRAGFVRIATGASESEIKSGGAVRHVSVPVAFAARTAEAQADSEILTNFMSCVGKMKQFIDECRRLVTSKLWVIARSYYQARGRHDFVYFADRKLWNSATESLLKLDDSSGAAAGGFNFKEAVANIGMNAVNKKMPGSFEVTMSETNSLQEFSRVFQQLLLTPLSQATGLLRSTETAWGDNWRTLLAECASLDLSSHSRMQQQQLHQHQHQHQHQVDIATAFGSASSQQMSSSFQSSSSVSRRVVTHTMTQDLMVGSQQAFSSGSAFRTVEQHQQHQQLQLHEDSKDTTDVFRVPSRSSSIASDSSKTYLIQQKQQLQQQQQQQQQQRYQRQASPLPSPKMTARMEPREPSRRGIMDDFCLFELKQRSAGTDTGDIKFLCGSEMEAHFLELTRLREELSRMQETSKAKQRQRLPELGAFSEIVTRDSDVCHAFRPQLLQSGAQQSVGTGEVNVRVGKATKDASVKFKEEVRVVSAGCQKLLECQDSLLNATKTVKSSNVSHKEQVEVASTGCQKLLECQDSLLNATKTVKSSNVTYKEEIEVASTGCQKLLECQDSQLNATKTVKSSNFSYKEKIEVASTGCQKLLECQDSLLNATKTVQSSNVSYKEEVEVAATGCQKLLECQDSQLNATKTVQSSNVSYKEEVEVASTGCQKLLECQDSLLNATKTVQNSSVTYKEEIEVAATGCQKLFECQDSLLNATKTVQSSAIMVKPPAGEDGHVLTMGKPIVDNGVFRINELSDNWTEMETKRVQESGAFVRLATRDAKSQKSWSRTPQVECGVDCRIAAPSLDVALQASSESLRIGLVDVGCHGVSGQTDASVSSRGTDMTDRHVLCDTGCCAASKQRLLVSSDIVDAPIKRPKQQVKPPTPPPKPRVVTDTGASGQTLSLRLAVVSPRRTRVQSEREVSKVENRIRELYIDKETTGAVRTARKVEKTVEDKEWRFPIDRKDFRPNQDSLPTPTLTLKYETAPKSPGLHSLQPQQTPSDFEAIQQRRQHRQHSRQQSLPPQQRTRRAPPQQLEGKMKLTRRDFRDQQPSVNQPIGISVQAKVEPNPQAANGAGLVARQQWTTRSLYVTPRRSAEETVVRQSRGDATKSSTVTQTVTTTTTTSQQQQEYQQQQQQQQQQYQYQVVKDSSRSQPAAVAYANQ